MYAACTLGEIKNPHGGLYGHLRRSACQGTTVVVSSLRNVSRGLAGHVLTARIKVLLNEIAIVLDNPALTPLFQQLGVAFEEKFRETNSQTAVVLGTMENDLVRVQRALQDGQKVSHHMLQEIAVELQKHADFLMHLEGLLLDLGDRGTKS